MPRTPDQRRRHVRAYHQAQGLLRARHPEEFAVLYDHCLTQLRVGDEHRNPPGPGRGRKWQPIVAGDLRDRLDFLDDDTAEKVVAAVGEWLAASEVRTEAPSRA